MKEDNLYIKVILEDPTDERIMMHYVDILSFKGFSKNDGMPVFEIKDNVRWIETSLGPKIGEFAELTLVHDLDEELNGPKSDFFKLIANTDGTIIKIMPMTASTPTQNLNVYNMDDFNKNVNYLNGQLDHPPSF